MKKYGLKLSKPQLSDYILGSSPLPIVSINPSKDWTDYLPVKERQNITFETYACACFSVLTCVETLIKFKYGVEENLADRFLACLVQAGVNEGSDPHIVCEFLRKLGCPPEEIYPMTNTFDEYYASPMPPKVYELAKEFTNKYDFKHEYVESKPESISLALTTSPLLISVPAWYERDGKYYRPEGMVDNHATVCYSERDGEFRRIFDSYEPFIKDVEWECMPTIIKRFHIEKKTINLPKVSLFSKILTWIKTFLHI